VFLNIRVVGNGDIQLLYIMHMGPNISSAMVSIRQNTTERLYGFVKQISRLTLLDLKQKKTNLVHTSSSTSTAKKNIKQIVTYAHSGNMDSIKNNIQRSIRNFIKKRANQFT